MKYNYIAFYHSQAGFCFGRKEINLGRPEKEAEYFNPNTNLFQGAASNCWVKDPSEFFLMVSSEFGLDEFNLRVVYNW